VRRKPNPKRDIIAGSGWRCIVTPDAYILCVHHTDEGVWQAAERLRGISRKELKAAGFAIRWCEVLAR
jgi:hypothetical protein